MRLLLCLIPLLAASAAAAETCKYVDKEGRVTYSNVPIKGARKLSCFQPPQAPAASAPEPTRRSLLHARSSRGSTTTPSARATTSAGASWNPSWRPSRNSLPQAQAGARRAGVDPPGRRAQLRTRAGAPEAVPGRRRSAREERRLHQAGALQPALTAAARRGRAIGGQLAGSGAAVLAAPGSAVLVTTFSSSALDALATAVLVLDPALRIVYVNPAAENLFKFSSRNVAGDPLDQCIRRACSADRGRPVRGRAQLQLHAVRPRASRRHRSSSSRCAAPSRPSRSTVRRLSARVQRAAAADAHRARRASARPDRRRAAR